MANGFSSTTTTNGLQDDESITSPLLLLRRSASNTTSQIAIVGSNPCPIESLDYELFGLVNSSGLLFVCFAVNYCRFDCSRPRILYELRCLLIKFVIDS
ncbi:hypothetical protein HanOQP8_Chr05g0179711 [Helianthus annuus]|nr:hypothetical protein HanOQP8_Chr05g0179711 [Helianthus annuus]